MHDCLTEVSYVTRMASKAGGGKKDGPTSERELWEAVLKKLESGPTISPETKVQAQATQLAGWAVAIIAASVAGTFWFTRNVAMKEDIAALRSDIKALEKIVAAEIRSKRVEHLSKAAASPVNLEELAKLLNSMRDGGAPPPNVDGE